MVTRMYWGWMGEPLPTSSRAIIKCNLEQTAALFSQGKAQVVEIAGTSRSQVDTLRFDKNMITALLFLYFLKLFYFTQIFN